LRTIIGVEGEQTQFVAGAVIAVRTTRRQRLRCDIFYAMSCDRKVPSQRRLNEPEEAELWVLAALSKGSVYSCRFAPDVDRDYFGGGFKGQP